MEKMFIDADYQDPTSAGRGIINETERAQSQAGIISYQCKVYRTLLDQGKLSGRYGKFAGRNEHASDASQS